MMNDSTVAVVMVEYKAERIAACCVKDSERFVMEIAAWQIFSP